MATISVSVVHGLEDVGPIKLRPDDELEANNLGLSGEEAVGLSVIASTQSFAVYFNGKLAAVWGIRRCGPIADAWLLTTAEVDNHPFLFIREGRRIIELLGEEFNVIRCEVAMDYRRAIRWLTRMGFTVRAFNGNLITMERINGGS